MYHAPSYYNTPYYHSYLGFYPPFGTSDYTNLIGNPLYYPNYITAGSVFYNQPWPAGYKVVGNQFVPISSSHSHTAAILIVLFLLIILGLSIAGGWWYWNRRNTEIETKPGSYADKF